MKRLLVSSLLLLFTAVASWAVDYHFELSHLADSAKKTTTIYARLAFGDNGFKYNWYNPGWWEVAAFIDGECRAISKGKWNNHLYSREDYNYNFFPLEVQGNYGSTSDIGKVITFKVYSHRMGLEYNLKTTQTIKFDGETHGDYYSDSGLIPLSCTELRGFDMNDFEMSLNSTVDLASYLILNPSNATIPNNLAFSINPSTYTLTVTGNGGYQFKPTAVGSYGVEGYNIYTDSLISIGFRGGTITVKKPMNYVSGLSINSGYQGINEVNKNDSTGLNDLLKKALKVSYFYPNEDPDEVPEWVSSNTNIVAKNSNGKWVPLKTGTCTMTAQVYDNSGNVRKSASLQVKVVNHVTSIDMKISNFWCNVGDDLTDYLPRTFEVLPTDADNKKVTYEITWSSGCLEKRSDGHIVAIADGLATIKITSNDNSSIYGELTVYVRKVATDISIKQNQVNVRYMGYGEPQDISDAIAANFSFLPLGGSFDGAFPTITSDNEDVVKVSLKQKDPETTAPEATDPENPEPADPVDPNDPANLNYAVEAQALKAGTANLTISLEVPNNMEWSIQGFGSTVEPTTVQKTFKVVVGQGTPTAISLPDSIVVNYGETLDLKKVLTVEPADAVFDYSKLEWSCNIVSWKEWISIDENSILTTLQPGMYDFELTATVPDTELKATAVLNIQNKVTSLTVREGYDTITVFKGDDRTLTQKVGEAFVITPKRYTDYLLLTSEDEDIVYESREWYPRKAGTTKIYARIYDYFDYKRGDFSKPLFEKYVTVVVQNRPEKISLPERVVVDYHETLDLTTVLTVEPADAVFDKSKLKWTYDEVAKQYFIVEGNTLKPQKPFMRGIYMKATLEDTDLAAETFVCIKNPAKSLTVREGYDTITVHVYEDEALKQKVSEAFVVSPEQCTDPLVITTENYEIAMPDPLREGNYVVARPGTTQFTATIYDYFDTEHKTPLFSKTITIVVLSAVEKISLPATTDMAESETLNLDNLVQLTLYPNQNFHPANLIWTVETGKESLVSIDDDHVLTALGKGSLTLTAAVPYTDLKASTVLTIHRYAKEMSIVSGFDTVYVCVGSKRLSAILDDALLVLPLGYTDKVEWKVADDGILAVIDGVLTPVKTGTTKVRAYIGNPGSPRLQTDEVTVEVGLQVTAIAAQEPTLHYANDVFTRRNTITKAVEDNFVLTPEASLLDYHPVFDTSDPEIIYVSTHDIPDVDGLQPITIEQKAGTATVGVTITVPDYDRSSSRTGRPTTKTLRATCQIAVEEGLQRLWFDEVVTHVGDRYEVKMKKVPEDVAFDFDPSKFSISIDPYDSRELPDGWTFAEWEASPTDPLTLVITAKCVDWGFIWVNYDEVTLGSCRLTVAPRYTVADGWQWLALYSGALDSQQAVKDAFGDKLAEIRSHDGLLVNDPDIGYIGDLQKLEATQTYKLRMQQVPDEGYTFTVDPTKVTTVFSGRTMELKAGWNWIGNSYQYFQPLSEVFQGSALTNGDMVQAKDAFATWNGSAWVGSLKYTTPGQGLLLYLNKAASVTMNGEDRMRQNLTPLNSELRILSEESVPLGRAQNSEFPSALSSKVSQLSTLNSQLFPDNMAMIASVDGVTDPLHTTIFAFVGDECRGVSVEDAGRQFITVHGNMGETVNFVAYDQLTGLYHRIERQCQLSPMTGTLDRPFLLHAGESLGIQNSQFSILRSAQWDAFFRKNSEAAVYDLQGRRIHAADAKPRKGVYIVRPAGRPQMKRIFK